MSGLLISATLIFLPSADYQVHAWKYKWKTINADIYTWHDGTKL